MTTVDPAVFNGVMKLLADYPDLDVKTLRGELEARSRRRPRPELLRPRSVSELVALVEGGLMTKTDAKRYLEVPRTRRTRPARGAVAQGDAR